MVNTLANWCFPDQKLFLMELFNQGQNYWLQNYVNAQTCETVKRAFQDNHKGSAKLSDSQVTLHWMDNQKKPLKQQG